MHQTIDRADRLAAQYRDDGYCVADGALAPAEVSGAHRRGDAALPRGGGEARRRRCRERRRGRHGPLPRHPLPAQALGADAGDARPSAHRRRADPRRSARTSSACSRCSSSRTPASRGRRGIRTRTSSRPATARSARRGSRSTTPPSTTAASGSSPARTARASSGRSASTQNPEYDFAPESFDFPYRDDDAIPVEVTAGSIVFFHGYLLHKSLKNRRTTGFRRALVNHYMSAESLLPWWRPGGPHPADPRPSRHRAGRGHRPLRLQGHRGRQPSLRPAGDRDAGDDLSRRHGMRG